VDVDVEGFDREMQIQRERAKKSRKGTVQDADLQAMYRDLVVEHGPSLFVGYDRNEAEGTVLAMLEGPDQTVEVFLDVTPFYAESGGQVGDRGLLRSSTGVLDVVDTTFAVPGLRRHVCIVREGEIEPGQVVQAAIDVGARSATRRNHTATHVLHWALREVLGVHVKQAGSLVAPERLRFDFSHYAPVTREEIERIETLANGQVLNNRAVRAYETSKEAAADAGAIAFFGDKYGDVVRVLEAGASIELCGGTHVSATGDIGTIKIVSESSIGSNLRRIEAVTGENTLRYLRDLQRSIEDVADVLGASTSEMPAAIRRKLEEVKELQDEIKHLRLAQARARAAEIVNAVVEGIVVHRVDGFGPAELREVALTVRQRADARVVVLGGVTDAGGVALVCALGTGVTGQAADVIRDAAKAVGGGGGGKGDVATAGGKNPDGLTEALELARIAASKLVGVTH